MNSEKYSRGRRGAPAKGVGRATGARVQIPLSPLNSRWFFFSQKDKASKKKNKKSCWQTREHLVRYNTLLKTAKRIWKDSKRNLKSCWQSENDVIEYWALPLRTATTWTLKMKDWTVFKTLKILIKKSPGWTSLKWDFRTKTNQTTVERFKQLASG